jgi:DNA repair protein RadD
MTLPLFPSGDPLMPTRMTSLRDYQQVAINTLREMVSAGFRRILVVGPTGMGKMVVLSAIIKTSTLPVIFVCHRQELIDGAARELAALGVTNVGVIRGDDDRFNPSASIQLCSIQTLARREKPFAGKKVLVLIDESHRSLSESYVTHIFGGPWEVGSIFLGFTATPTRLDGKPLGELYEQLLIVADYATLIKRGFIAAPDCYSAPLTPDLSGVGVLGGDYEEGALGEVMRRQELVGNIVEHWLKLAHLHAVYDAKGHRVPMRFAEGPRRPTFCFAVNIAHSHAICEQFERAGVRVAHLDGKTPEDQRRAMLRDLASGTIEIVSNCMVLLEGVDVPEAKCVIHARPTKSLVLWRQSVGRILRPWCAECRTACSVPGHHSVVPLLLDHGNSYAEHGPPHDDYAWSLKARSGRRKTAMSGKLCPKCFAYVNVVRIFCPFCSYEFPAPDPQSLPQQTDVQLALRDSTPEQAKRELFDKMVLLARSRGYKPGFASAKYKEKYGTWPPESWGDGVKSIFIADLRWQDAVARRERAKREEAAASIPQTPLSSPVLQDPPGSPIQDQEGSLYEPTPKREADPWQLADDGDSLSSWLDEQGIR